MRRIAVVLCAAALASGLGASPAGAASTRTLVSVLVHGGEMRGFSIQGTPSAGTTPAAFVQRVYKLTGSSATADVAALASEGFVAGASEYLRAPHGIAASQIWEFKDERAADAYLRNALLTATAALRAGSEIRALRVGVPDARAFVASSDSGRLVVSDAYMLSGRCMLFVGDELSGAPAAASAPVLAASRSVERRARALCG